MGHSLSGAVSSLADWSRAHKSAIAASRAHWDATHPGATPAPAPRPPRRSLAARPLTSAAADHLRASGRRRNDLTARRPPAPRPARRAAGPLLRRRVGRLV
jgi:hypothetical protein